MPHNEGYFHAAYAIAAAVYLGYAASILLRARALRGRLDRGAGRPPDRS